MGVQDFADDYFKIFEKSNFIRYVYYMYDSYPIFNQSRAHVRVSEKMFTSV